MTSSSYQVEKKDVLIILGFIVAAFILRLFYLADYRSTEVYPLLAYSDSYSYYTWARDIASGELLGIRAFMKWPLYAYALAGLFKAYGPSISLVYLLQFLLGSLTCGLVYLTATLLINRIAGIIAGILFLSYGIFLFYEGLLIYTSLSLFLNLFLFLSLLQLGKSQKKRDFLLLGLLFGLCTVTQANILLFGIIAAAWLLRGAQEALKKAALFLFGFSLVVGLATAGNFLAEKDFVPITGNIGINFFAGNNSEALGTFSSPMDITMNQEDMFRDSRIIAEASRARRLKTSEVSMFWLGKSLDFIREKPFDFARLFLKKIILMLDTREHVHDIEYSLIADKIRLFKFLFTDLRFILPLAVIGMTFGAQCLRERRLLYLAAATIILIVPVFFVATRYRITAVPFLIVFAAAGVCAAKDALLLRNWRRSLFILLTACLVLFSLTLLQYQAQRIAPADIEKKAAVEHYLSRALLLEQSRRYDAAYQELSLAAQIEPDNRRLLFRLGVLYFKAGNLDASEAVFRGVIQGCPLCVDAYYNLGLLCNQRQRPHEALPLLERAVYLDPDDAGAHFELGLACRDTGDSARAAQEFALALKRLNRWRSAERATVEEELKKLTP